MSHQQSSHEQKPDSELIAEVLEQTGEAFGEQSPSLEQAPAEPVAEAQ